MKLIVVNDGAYSINTDTVTKVQNAEDAIYIHTQDNSGEVYLVGRYKNKENADCAFRVVNNFIASESDGYASHSVLNIADDEKLDDWVNPYKILS